MRIVDVCAFYAPQGGGVKTYVEQKLRAGPGAGHEIVVLAPGRRAERVAFGSGATLITIPGARLMLDRRYHYFHDEAALHATLDALAPDLIEVSSPWNSASMVARWRGDASKVLVMHADPLSAYAYRWFGPVASRDAIDRGFDWFWRHLRRLDRDFDMIVSASDSLSLRLRRGGITKVQTVSMGVEPHLFSPARRDEALRRRLLRKCHLGDDAALLIGVGRLGAEKRWPMVIEAVTASGYARPVGLMLIGDGRDRGKVLKAAANNPHIHLAAPTSDRESLASILASGDALVHGCEAETFCMVAAEARASGLPLIVPDEGGASDQFRQGQGARFRSGDGASLADAIGRVLANLGEHRVGAIRSAAQVPTRDDHFAALFAGYGQFPEEMRDAA